MKKIILFLILVSAVILCGCSPTKISHNENKTELYYNGHTYIEQEDCAYYLDRENKECVTIEKYRGIWIGGTGNYYGNDKECPDYIFQEGCLWLRADLTIDKDICYTVWKAQSANKHLNLQENETFSFSVSEITTGEVVQKTSENEEEFDLLYSFTAKTEPYSAVYVFLYIYERDGEHYLCESSSDDCYVITEEFYDNISRIVPIFVPIER